MIAGVCVLVFFAAPRSGDFWWSEAPRNALNGAFVLDFLRELPLRNAKQWAVEYYYRYPALTILFYPPLFHGVLAAFYALFGVSHAVAVACVNVFLFVLATGVYAIVRTTWSPVVALAAALLLIGAPEVMRWGQQVMLEIPMLALATWSVFFVLRYRDTGRVGDLWVAVGLLIAACYTKQTALAIAPALAVALVASQQGVLRRPHFWLAACFGVVALVPLAVLQLRFGQVNLMSIVERPDVGTARLSLAGLTWYITRLPEIAGAVSVALAGIFVIAGIWFRSDALKERSVLLLGVWFGVCLVALTFIHLKETRHGLLLAVPVAVAASLSSQLVARREAAGRLVLVLAVISVGWSVVYSSAPRITGYREAAVWVADHVPKRSRVMFVGTRDGSFIFNLRQREDRRDLSVVRADKLLLGINIMPEFGLNPRDLSEQQIGDMMNRYGISHVLTVPRIWSEAKVMENLHRVLRSRQFTEVARLPIRGAAPEREIVVYRNLGPLKDPPEGFEIRIPAAGITLSP